jgi:futalosine hydrolase
MTLLIAAALELELSLLKGELKALPAGRIAGRSFSQASVGHMSVFLGEVGIGVVSAAVTLGGLVARLGVSRIVMCGSAGAFGDSELGTGDLAVASSETLAEVGLCTTQGVGSAYALGLPDLVQEIGLDGDLVRHLERGAAEVARTRVVKSLTVVGVSADIHQARSRAELFGAGMENMEGYAAALVGLQYGIPVGEVRGISNVVGNRDKQTWNLSLAGERAQKALLQFLRRLADS